MTDHLTLRRAARRLTTAILGGLIGVTSVAAPARADVGDVTEYPITTTADSFPAGITTGPDGALWFAESNVPKVGRITTGGTVTDYDLPSQDGAPFDITPGRDGALWFTEPFGGRIGRITTGGEATEFTLPTPDSFPMGITHGPDGALWFTEQAANNIGRITVDGKVTEYPIPTPSSVPYNIAAAPDGTVWFTELQGGKVGRITPDGTITEFPVPRGDFSFGIAAGPGGMWFPLSHSIARITPAGRLTEFPLPSEGNLPDGITRGPDGTMWFADQGGGVGRITPAGVVTVFPVADGADKVPFHITTGPDRNLWFTELFANAVGRAQALPPRSSKQTPEQSAAPSAHRPTPHLHRTAPPALCEHRPHGPQLPDRAREILCG